MTIGSIVFGPKTVPPLPDFVSQTYQATANLQAHACNCIGPQLGQDKCPCALRGESEQGRRMVRDGVVIDGQKYRLVPAEAAGDVT